MAGQQTKSPRDIALLPDVLDYIFAGTSDVLILALTSEFTFSAPNSGENAAMVSYELLGYFRY